MNYRKAYNNLIERAQNRNILGYSEKHHIVPKCLGGSNKKSNIVRLTAREHYIAHVLLVKIYPKERKLIYAAAYMCSSSKNHKGRSGNRIYEWLKIQRSKAMSELHKGKIVSEETRQKLREKNKNYRPSEDAKRRSREAQIGHPVSEETKKKISEANKGGKSRTGQQNTRCSCIKCKRETSVNSLSRHVCNPEYYRKTY